MLKRLRVFLGALLLLAVGCGDRAGSTTTVGAATSAGTCYACGDGNLSCSSTLAACVGTTSCVTTALGGLTLNADGTYTQSTLGTSGTWTVSNTFITLSPSGSTVKALIAEFDNGGCTP